VVKQRRETGEIFRFFMRTPAEQRRIVVYAEHEGYYPYFEGLINELISRSQGLAYVTSDPSDPVLGANNPLIAPFYIRRLLPYFLQMVNCHAFVMTLTDLHRYQLKRSRFPVHYVYLFHSLVSTHMMYRAGAFDHYDSIICPGPRHVDEIRRHEGLYKLAAKELIPGGYYRLERVYDNYRKYESRGRVSAGAPTVLIAPSWGPENVIESCGERLTAVLLEAGFRVIVRPHPETVKRHPGLIDALESKFRHRRAFTMERSVARDDSLILADVLICDCSGVALEYALGTERPVLFLDVPYKVQNQDYGSLGIVPLELKTRPGIGILLSPDQIAHVPEEVRRLIAARSEYRSRLVKMREELVSCFGRSAAVAADHVMNVLERSRTVQVRP